MKWRETRVVSLPWPLLQGDLPFLVKAQADVRVTFQPMTNNCSADRCSQPAADERQVRVPLLTYSTRPPSLSRPLNNTCRLWTQVSSVEL